MAKVIIIEEDSAVRDLLEIVVRRLGHEPAPLLSLAEQPGQAAAALIEPAHPDALAAAHRLRREQPELEIVFVSTLPPMPGTDELLPSAHLLKPFALAELAGAVERCIDAAALRTSRALPAV